MSVIQLAGVRELKGEIKIQGSKNAVLPVMAASLLHRGTTVITNVPRIQDVECMLGILRFMGCACSFEGRVLRIDASSLSSVEVPKEEGERMRSSIMLLGPLLGREKEAVLCRPGGCSIGERPIDFHLELLRQMGAEVSCEGMRICASAAKLRGCDLKLPFPSVGATENIIMAAAAAEGTTRLSGAAREPEIRILCEFLQQLGVRIEGAGSDTVVIQGTNQFHDSIFRIPGDRIVAGTYLGTLMAVGGELYLREAPAEQMETVLKTARGMGTEISCSPDGILARRVGTLLPADFSTGPYPDFPTDLQSVWLVGAALAKGNSTIRETVFEERFATAQELQKLGAHIIIKGREARIEGKTRLKGCEVCARDLRGGAALVAAGLAAEGETTVHGYSFIKRGYEDICRDLQAAGARIWLENEKRQG